MDVQSNNQPVVNQVILIQRKLTLEARVRNGANWFFWIAGLSILNSIIHLFGGTLTFIFGLGATQFIDGFASALAKDTGSITGIIVQTVGLGFDIGLAGLYVVAGFLGRKRFRWVIIAGMILYILDGLLFVMAREWLSVAFHVLAILGLIGCLKAINDLSQLEQNKNIDVPLSTIAAMQQSQESSNQKSAIRALIIVVIFACFVFLMLGIYFSMTK